MFDKIVLDADWIRPVSRPAAREYAQQQDRLRKFVDDRLSTEPELARLLGGNPVQLLTDNHIHHIQFMSNVFLLNNYDLLARITLWVYRAYHRQGLDYQYFVLELQAWAEAVRLLMTPDSAAEILPVYQWLREHHHAFVAAAENPEERTGMAPLDKGPTDQARRTPFGESLLAGDFKTFSELTLQFLSEGNTLESLYVKIFQPCLYEIGELWERGHISVAQEHLATAIVNRTMLPAFQKTRFLSAKKGRVLIAAAPNEHHEIGAHMTADLLLLEGWEVFYLGANLPQTDLLSMLDQVKPLFVGLSVVLPFNLVYVSEIVRTLRNTPALADTKVLVGGLAFAHSDKLWKSIGADAYAADAADSVRIAQEWWEQATDAVS